MRFDGHTQVYLSNMVTAMPQVRAGKMRALAVSSLARSPVMPEIPTIAESALPNFEEVGQHGIVAPAGIPKEILARLHGAIVAAMRNPEIVKRLADEGSVVVASTPEEYRARILRDTAKSMEIVRLMNLKLEQTGRPPVGVCYPSHAAPGKNLLCHDERAQIFP